MTLLLIQLNSTFKGFYAAAANHDVTFGYESSEEDILNSFRICGGGCYGFSGVDALKLEHQSSIDLKVQ